MRKYNIALSKMHLSKGCLGNLFPLSESVPSIQTRLHKSRKYVHKTYKRPVDYLELVMDTECRFNNRRNLNNLNYVRVLSKRMVFLKNAHFFLNSSTSKDVGNTAIDFREKEINSRRFKLFDLVHTMKPYLFINDLTYLSKWHHRYRPSEVDSSYENKVFSMHVYGLNRASSVRLNYQFFNAFETSNIGAREGTLNTVLLRLLQFNKRFYLTSQRQLRSLDNLEDSSIFISDWAYKTLSILYGVARESHLNIKYSLIGIGDTLSKQANPFFDGSDKLSFFSDDARKSVKSILPQIRYFSISKQLKNIVSYSSYLQSVSINLDKYLDFYSKQARSTYTFLKTQNASASVKYRSSSVFFFRKRKPFNKVKQSLLLGSKVISNRALLDKRERSKRRMSSVREAQKKTLSAYEQKPVASKNPMITRIKRYRKLRKIQRYGDRSYTSAKKNLLHNIKTKLWLFRRFFRNRARKYNMLNSLYAFNMFQYKGMSNKVTLPMLQSYYSVLDATSTLGNYNNLSPFFKSPRYVQTGAGVVNYKTSIYGILDVYYRRHSLSEVLSIHNASAQSSNTNTLYINYSFETVFSFINTYLVRHLRHT